MAFAREGSCQQVTIYLSSRNTFCRLVYVFKEKVLVNHPWFLRCRSVCSPTFESFRLQTLRVLRIIALYHLSRKHVKEVGNSETTVRVLSFLSFSACHWGTDHPRSIGMSVSLPYGCHGKLFNAYEVKFCYFTHSKSKSLITTSHMLVFYHTSEYCLPEGEVTLCRTYIQLLRQNKAIPHLPNIQAQK